LIASIFLMLQAATSLPGTPTETTAVPASERAAKDVVVTGVSLASLKKAVDDCLQSHCPATDDIVRSQDYANGQFALGDYAGSRETLRKARHRNARYASSIPVEVAGLHRATGRITGLVGLPDSEQLLMIDAVDALKAGLNKDDVRVLLARLDVGDAYARDRRLDEAIERYDTVRSQARRLSLRPVEGMAMLRKAVLLSAVASTQSIYNGRARAAVKEIQQTSDADMTPFRNACQLIQVQLTRKASERDAAFDAAIARMEPLASTRPTLLYSPPVELAPSIHDLTANSDTPWADISFLVTADGHVGDVQLVAKSGHLERQWLRPVIQATSQRRYMPMALSGSTGLRQTVRYSFVGDLVARSGSHLLYRSPTPRVVSIDMTPDGNYLPLKDG
jgi:hypothetical protein